jgi:hypothetical protein
MPVQPYTDTSVKLLKALRSGGALKLDGFAEHVRIATGRAISWQQVAQWCDGSLHFPADLVPVLADFMGDRADVVLEAYAAPAGFRVVRDVAVPAADGLETAGNIAELATKHLRAKIRALRDGVEDARERAELRDLLREMLREIEASDAGLRVAEGTVEVRAVPIVGIAR